MRKRFCSFMLAAIIAVSILPLNTVSIYAEEGLPTPTAATSAESTNTPSPSSSTGTDAVKPTASASAASDIDPTPTSNSDEQTDVTDNTGSEVLDDPAAFTVKTEPVFETEGDSAGAFLHIQLENVEDTVTIIGYSYTAYNDDGSAVVMDGVFDESFYASIGMEYDGMQVVDVNYSIDDITYKKTVNFTSSIIEDTYASLYGSISMFSNTEDTLKVYLQTDTGYKPIDEGVNAADEVEWNLQKGENTAKRLLKVVANFSEASRDQTRTVTINIPEGYRIFQYSAKTGTDAIYSYNLDGTPVLSDAADPESKVTAVSKLDMSDSENEGLASSVLSVPEGDPYKATSNDYTDVPAGQEFGAQSAGKFSEDNYTFNRKYDMADANGYEVRPGKLTYTFNEAATVASIYVTLIPDDYLYSHATAANTVLDGTTVTLDDIINGTQTYKDAIAANAKGDGQLLKNIDVTMVSGDTTLNKKFTTRVVSGPTYEGMSISPSSSVAVIENQTADTSYQGASEEASIGLTFGSFVSAYGGYAYIGRQAAKEMIIRLTYPSGTAFEYFDGPFVSYLDTDGDGKASTSDTTVTEVCDNTAGTCTATAVFKDLVVSGGQYYSNTTITAATALYPHFKFEGNYYMPETMLNNTAIDESMKKVTGTDTLKAKQMTFTNIEMLVKPYTAGVDDTNTYIYVSRQNPKTVVFQEANPKIQVVARNTTKWDMNENHDFPAEKALSSIYVKNTGNMDTGEVQIVFTPDEHTGLKAMNLPVPASETVKNIVIWTSDGKVYTQDGLAVSADLNGDGDVDDENEKINTTIAAPELADMKNNGTSDFPTAKVDVNALTDGNGDRIYPSWTDANGTPTGNVPSSDQDVYITRLQYDVSNFPVTGNPIYGSNYTGYKGVYYGVVLDHQNASATMTVNKINENRAVKTQLGTSTATVYVANETQHQINAYAGGSTKKASYTSGETVELNASTYAYSNIGVNTNEYTYPITYITVPDGLTLDLNSVTFYQYARYYTGENTSEYKLTKTPIDKDKYLVTYDESTKTYRFEFLEDNAVIITSGDTITQEFDYMRVFFNFEIKPTFEGDGTAFKMQDIVFFDLQGTSITSQQASGTIVKDTRNVTGNGTSYGGLSPTTKFTIIPLTDLVVKNGIRAKGSGTGFYYYDGTNTSIALVNADNEAEIKLTWANISEQTYSNAEIYMTIPKKGAAWAYFFNNIVLNDTWNADPINKDVEWDSYLNERIALDGFTTYYSVDAVASGDLPTEDSKTWEPVTAAWITDPTDEQLKAVNMVKFVSNAPIQAETSGSVIFSIHVNKLAKEGDYDFWRTLNSVKGSEEAAKRWSYGSVMAATPSAGTVSGKVWIDELVNDGLLSDNEEPYSDLQLILSEEQGKITPINIPIQADGTFKLTTHYTDDEDVVQTLDRYLPTGKYTLTIRNKNSDTVHISKSNPTVFGDLDPNTGIPTSIA